MTKKALAKKLLRVAHLLQKLATSETEVVTALQSFVRANYAGASFVKGISQAIEAIKATHQKLLSKELTWDQVQQPKLIETMRAVLAYMKATDVDHRSAANWHKTLEALKATYIGDQPGVDPRAAPSKGPSLTRHAKDLQPVELRRKLFQIFRSTVRRLPAEGENSFEFQEFYTKLQQRENIHSLKDLSSYIMENSRSLSQHIS